MDPIARDIEKLLGVKLIRTLPILGVQQFRLKQGEQLNNVILALRSNPAVQYAEYNYLVTGLQQRQSPDDPQWTRGWLWGLTKIQMAPAWLVMHDASPITVAVLDSGINYLHDDLSPNIPGSMPNQRGAVTCDSTGDPMDTNGHGTLVAGIIGAKGNNGKGSVGINWDVRLWAVKFLCGINTQLDVPSGSISDAIEAIESAIYNRADIINNSWRVVPPVDQGDINILHEAVGKTNCEGKDLPPNCKPALFVAAAGNALSPYEDRNSDNANGKVYPANFSNNNIIAVAAVDENDELWPDSHYGVASVPLAAPGVNIDSTFITTPGGDGFSVLTGTSASAPHVAGCAALLQAQSLRSSGSLLSIQSLKDKILNSADKNIGALNSYITMGRRLNCGNALTDGASTADGVPPVPPIDLSTK